MRFLALRTTSVYKEAQCLDCGWRVTSIQLKNINYVSQRGREHTQETGHTVEVGSTRISTYTAIPKE